jgi:hypothetical protein
MMLPCLPESRGLNRRIVMKGLAGLTGAAALMFTVACGQTDAGITTAVKAKLAADDTVKAYQVDVDTNNKVVTLRGEVDSPAAETMAIQLARDTDGVRDVIDEIRVVQVAPTSGIEIDEDLGRTVEEAGDAIKDAGKRIGDAAKDAVTDDDRDSDKDGK